MGEELFASQSIAICVGGESVVRFDKLISKVFSEMFIYSAHLHNYMDECVFGFREECDAVKFLRKEGNIKEMANVLVQFCNVCPHKMRPLGRVRWGFF